MITNDTFLEDDYVITNRQLTDLENANTMTIVRVIAREIRKVQKIRAVAKE
jgi:hypothetical protein